MTTLAGNAPLALGRLPFAVRLYALLRAMRPLQWIKNLACFAGLVFSGRLFDIEAIVAACLAFVSFGLAASAVYLFNDVCDRDFDRVNPNKRNRPIASGLVSVPLAIVSSAVLMLLSFWVAAALAPICAGIVVVYLAMNAAYSARLKHAVLLDVAVIAIGFVLRVLLGVYAVGVKPTSWIVLCMFFLAMFFGFAKRRGELEAMDEGETSRRPVLAKYRGPFLDIQLAMTASMSILCYALYTVAHHGNATLVVTVPLVAYGIARYMLLVMVHGKGDAPERVIVGDRLLVATAVVWLSLCVVIIYGDLQFFAQ